MFKKIFLNTLAQVFSKAWTAIISILLLAVLTNYLSQELFWLYSKLYNYLWIFSFLADLWLYTITIREINKNKENSSKIVSNVMTLRTIFWIIIILLAILIAYFLPWYNSKISLIWIFIVSIFTLSSLINSSILALMQANLKMQFSLFSTIFWKIISFVWILLVVYVFFTKETTSDFAVPFYYILISWLIWIIINTWLNYFYAKKITSFGFDFDWKYMYKIFKISLPYWLALFLSVIYFKIDIILISILEPKNLANISIALYSLPMKIVEVLMTLWWFYLNSILWELSKNFKENNFFKIKNLFNISFKILLSFWVFLFVMWSLFKNHIIKIISNESYINPINHIYSSSDVFSLVLLVLVFYFISNLFIYLFIASNNEKKLLKINIIVALFNIIWNIIVIPKYSFMWAAYVTVFSQILLFLIAYKEINKNIKIVFPVKFIIINLFFALIVYLIWYKLLNEYSISFYIDILLYWTIIWLFYLWFFYVIYNRNKNYIW